MTPIATIDKFLPTITISKIVTESVAEYAAYISPNFNPRSIIGRGEDVAVFGTFAYMSNTLGQTLKSPFSIHPNTKEGFIIYFPSMRNVAKAAT